MASYLLKNQILKHLSKFFKNLTPEQLSTSSHGSSITLNNLELSEDTLSSLFLLSSPSSTPSSKEASASLVKVSSAFCSSIAISIPWTSITTSPINIAFDTLYISVEILESPSASPVHQPKAPTNTNVPEDEAEKSYGFVDKIIDGISFSLNALHVTMTAPKFTATLDLSFLKANPATPTFKPFPSKKMDLRLSRIKCQPFVLLFKTIEWQTLKLEAKAKTTGDMSPTGAQDVIRLISSGGSCNLIVKKSLLNRQVVDVKSSFSLEDILWLLTATPTQTRDALTLIDSLSSLVVSESSNKVSNSKNKNLNLGPGNVNPNLVTKGKKKDDALTKLYFHHDLKETSIHFAIKNFQLQLVDDMNSGASSSGAFHSKFPPLTNGSALLISLSAIKLSIYPEHYHDRDNFRRKSAIDSGGIESDGKNLHIELKVKSLIVHCVGLNDPRSSARKKRSRKREEDDKKYFLCPSHMNTPDELPAISFNFTHYYCNDIKKNSRSSSDNLPSNFNDSIYIQVGPTKINFDPPTVLWIHAFILPLLTIPQFKSKEEHSSSGQEDNVEMLVEVIMPTITLDKSDPFKLFPSPFSKVPNPVFDVTCDDDDDSIVAPITSERIEIKVTQVRITKKKSESSDKLWDILINQAWIEHVWNEESIGDEERFEIVHPIVVSGTITLLEETPVSLEEIRINLSSDKSVQVAVNPRVLSFLVPIAFKVDRMGDFIANDKMEMKLFHPEVLDSALNINISLPSAEIALFTQKNQCDVPKNLNNESSPLLVPDPPSTVSADSVENAEINMIGAIPRSVSAPEDFNVQNEEDVLKSLQTLDVTRLSGNDDGQSSNSSSDQGRVTASSMAAELVSLESRLSDNNDDFYIVKHYQTSSGVSLSSSPSVSGLGSLQPPSAFDPQELIEEAEDAGCMFDDGDTRTVTKKEPSFDKLLELKVGQIQVIKSATDFHSETKIAVVGDVSIQETCSAADPLKPAPFVPCGSEISSVKIKSEIKYSQEGGKQEMTEILVSEMNAVKIHSKTIEHIGQRFVTLIDLEPSQEKTSPEMKVSLQKTLVQLIDGEEEPTLQLNLDGLSIQKNENNVLSFRPYASTNYVSEDTERGHRKVFRQHGESGNHRNTVSNAVESDEKFVEEILSRNEELECELKRLKEENERLKKSVQN